MKMNAWVRAVVAVTAATTAAARGADGLVFLRSTAMTRAHFTFAAVFLLLLFGADSLASAAESSTAYSAPDLIQLSIEYTTSTGSSTGTESGTGTTIDSGASLRAAAGMAQELLAAFAHEPTLQAITLVPVPQTQAAAQESNIQSLRKILLYEGTMFGATGGGDGVMSVDINPPPVLPNDAVVVLWEQGDSDDDHTESGAFPQVEAILQLVRNRVDQIQERLRRQEIEEAADATPQPEYTAVLTVDGEEAIYNHKAAELLWVDEYSDKATVDNHVVISYTPTRYQCLGQAADMAVQLLHNANNNKDASASIDSYAGTLRMVTLMPNRYSFDENGFSRYDDDTVANPTNGEGHFQVHLQQSVSLPPRLAPPNSETNVNKTITTIAAMWDRQKENGLLKRQSRSSQRTTAAADRRSSSSPNFVMYPKVADVQKKIARFRREQACIGSDDIWVALKNAMGLCG